MSRILPSARGICRTWSAFAAGLYLLTAPLTAQTAKPTVCSILPAAQPVAEGAPKFEDLDDTPRLQAALDGCPAGEAVELSSARNNTAFVSGPLLLPGGVTLWIDPGVILFASRHPTDFSRPGEAPRALLTVAAGALALSPARLEGYGTVDARGAARLLAEGIDPRTSWWDLPLALRPTLLRTEGAFASKGITLREAPGVTLLLATPDPGLLSHVKITGNPVAPGTEAIVVLENSPGSEIADSVLTGSAEAFASPASDIVISNAAVYSGTVAGLPASGPCLAQSVPVLACLPASLPPMLGDLVQTGPRAIAAVLTVPDTSLPDPSGTVQLLEGEIVVAESPISSSSALFDLQGLPPGAHRLHARAVSSGLDFGDLPLTLSRPAPAEAPPTLTLTSSATTFPYNTAITLTAALSNGTGAVSFADGMTSLGQSVMGGGVASITLSSLGLGPHTVYALYAGDAVNPVQRSPALMLQVNPVTSIVSLAGLPPSVPYGTTLHLAASVLPANAQGTIGFREGHQTLGTVPLSGGAAALDLGSLAPGTHLLVAAYSGDQYDLAASSNTAEVTVTPLTTLTTLSAAPGSAVFGTPIQLSVGVSPSDATGPVAILDGTATVARVTLLSGAGSAQVSTLAPGLHLLQASYAGDSIHSGSSSSTAAVEIDRAPTTTVLAALPATVARKAAVPLTAQVSPGTATGTVVFLDRATGTLGQASLSSGMAGLNLASLASGTHTILASYSGDANYGPSISAVAVVTVPPSPASLMLSGVPASLPYSAPATLIFILSPAIPEGSVVVTDSAGGSFGAVLLHAGMGSMPLGLLAPGTHVLRAHFAGTPEVAAADASLNVLSTTDPTTTTLMPAQGAVPAGSPVLLNIRVATAYSNSPGGTVSVRVTPPNGSSLLLTAQLANPLPGGGFATMSLDSAALGLGAFSAQATYAGDVDDLTSTSPAIVFSVVPAPTTLTLTLPVPAIPTGQPSTVLARVSSLAATPAGTVSFFRDGNLFASLLVIGGLATAQLPGLPVGTYTLSATFQPAALFGPSAAPAQTLLVTLPVSLTLNPSSLTMKPGTVATSTLSITPLSGYTGSFTASCLSASVYVGCTADPLSGSVPAMANLHLHAAANTYTQAEWKAAEQGVFELAMLAPALLLISPRRKRPMRLLLFLLATCGLANITGCGQGTFFDVPPGAYAVTVLVTASGSTLAAPLTVTISK